MNARSVTTDCALVSRPVSTRAYERDVWARLFAIALFMANNR